MRLMNPIPYEGVSAKRLVEPACENLMHQKKTMHHALKINIGILVRMP